VRRDSNQLPKRRKPSNHGGRVRGCNMIGAGWWWLPASAISTEVLPHSRANIPIARVQSGDVAFKLVLLLWDPGHAVWRLLTGTITILLGCARGHVRGERWHRPGEVRRAASGAPRVSQTRASTDAPQRFAAAYHAPVRLVARSGP
jgi:hypothetical protein